MLWLEIDKRYDTLFINVPISVCAEPNPNSYMGAMKKTSLSNVMSKYYDSMYVINKGKGYYLFKQLLMAYIKVPYNYLCARQFNKTNYTFKRLFNDISTLSDKILICFCLPIAYCLRIIKNK